MFRSRSRKGTLSSGVKALVFGTALLVYPCGAFAQHGAGRSVGDPGANTGGLNTVGKPTGVVVGDDLKDFHAALAVQATSQQILTYAAMVKSTAAANAELQAFLEHLGKQSDASELTSRGTTLNQAIETARAQNKKFLDGLSDPQKSGLKEIVKKLIKADADLSQQALALAQEMRDAKAVSQQMASSAQSLDHTLTSFQIQQLGLGEEMSIRAANNNVEDSTFNLPTVRNSINFQNQPIVIATSGIVSKGAMEGGQNTFKLELTADMSDLQQNITEVLRTQIDKADRCGERIAIQSAVLSPRAPASLVLLQLHFERWACFGRDTNELAEGNGTIEVKLTPAVAEDGTLRLVPEIGRINAEGLVGELLRSGSLGDALRDKIAESLLSAVRQGGDFKLTLPPAAQGYATLHRAQFQSTGAGKLVVVLDGEIRVSDDKATSLTSELKGRSSSQETTPR